MSTPIPLRRNFGASHLRGAPPSVRSIKVSRSAAPVPSPRDQRTASTYIFGAVCPKDSDRDADVPCKTFEELDAAFKERGLPVERIYPMLNLQSFHQPEVEEPEDVE